MWIWLTKCFCLCCFICCEICGGSLYAARGYFRSDYHIASQQYNAVGVWLWPVPNIKFESLQWKKVCATLIQNKMSRCFCHSAQTHAQHFLSAYKHFISETFPDVNCKCITHIPSAHIIFRCSCVCPVSCWTRWTASTHCTESRWSWPPTDRTLWTQPCCGPEDWIVKSVRSSPLLLVLCLLALCEHTQQI